MAEIGSAFITIAPSMKGFGGALNAQAGGTIRSTGKSLGATFGKAFLLGGSVLAAAGIGSFLKDSIAEAREAQKVGALTANVIKTTGGAAKISAKQVGDLATSLSLKTGVDDEAIQSGSNLLLTFTKVANAGKGQAAVFDRATAAAVDLSASGFGDINGASKQLGKALQDPVKGITALSKSGVTFTEEQKAQIKAMTESGNVLGAQQIILGEVEHQVKGAAAATSTYGEKAGVAFGNIKEQVGTALLPVIDGLAKAFLKAVPTITRVIDGVGPALSTFGAALSNIKRAVGFLFDPKDTDAARGFGEVIDNVFGNTGKLIGPLRTVGDGVRYLIDQVRTAIPQVKAVAGEFIAGLLPVLGRIGSALLTQVVPLVRAMATTFATVVLPAIRSLVGYLVANLVPVFRQVVDIIVTRVIPIIGSLATFFYTTLYPAIVQIVTQIAGSLRPVFEQLVDTYRSKVLPALDKLFAAFQKNQPAIQKVILVVVKAVGAVLRLAAAILGKVLPVFIKINAYILTKVIGAITSLIGAFGRIADEAFAGAKDLQRFVDKVKEKVVRVKEFFTNLPGKITAALGDLSTLLVDAGKSLITGLITGITNKVGALKSKLSGITKLIPKVKGPESKDKTLLTPAGQLIMDGLINGIASKESALAKALRGVTMKISKSMGKNLDKVKERLETRISDFGSLSDSVASNFADNLFGAQATEAVTDAAGKVITPAMSASQNFLASLTSTKGSLTSLLGDFKTLKGFGLSGQFLAQLFSDGGFPLIHELASDQGQATAAGALFGDIQNISKGLGDAVAMNTPDIGGGVTLKDLRDVLRETNKLIAKAPQETAGAVNGAAASGKRKKKTGGKK